MTRLLITLIVALGRIPVAGQLVQRTLLFCKYVSIRAMQRLDKGGVQSRTWSNRELARIAPVITGNVVNVSGWRDQDKEGRRYRDYFVNARSYSVTNYRGENGLQGVPEEKELDLESDLAPELARSFDAVFNHTVLEHVFDFHKALDTLCGLSDDLIILVTPFSQSVHYAEGSYGDWWRFTPACLKALLEQRGFSTVYQSANDNPWYHIYVITIAARNPDAYRGPRSTLTAKIGQSAFAAADLRKAA